MSLAVALTRASEGVTAPLVTVEVHLSGGLPATSIVGLPEAAVREARDRVRVAIQNTQFEYPARRVTVNLAPAELPKDGGRFDLAIALGILAAGGQLPRDALQGREFLGELALSGELRPVPGILPALLRARPTHRSIVIPAGNAPEAALLGDVDVRVARNLAEVCAHLRGIQTLPNPTPAPPASSPPDPPDLADVRGQLHARRALEIAAAGGHHLLLVGPPGTGKSMLAARLPGILPPLTDAEAIEACAVRSIAGTGFDAARWRERPFRAPHHTASGVALVGGGSHPRPGEVSLAHRGVLFLDELPEFDRRVLEVLREPMESGRIVISRAAHQAEFPARFQLVAAFVRKSSAPQLDRLCKRTLAMLGRMSHMFLGKRDPKRCGKGRTPGYAFNVSATVPSVQRACPCSKVGGVDFPSQSPVGTSMVVLALAKWRKKLGMVPAPVSGRLARASRPHLHQRAKCDPKRTVTFAVAFPNSGRLTVDSSSRI